MDILNLYYTAIEAHLATLSPDEREWDADELLDDEHQRWIDSEAEWHDIRDYVDALPARFPLVAQLRANRRDRRRPWIEQGCALAALAQAMRPTR